MVLSALRRKPNSDPPRARRPSSSTESATRSLPAPGTTSPSTSSPSPKAAASHVLTIFQRSPVPQKFPVSQKSPGTPQYTPEADAPVCDLEEPPDLRELNASLATLVAIFPDVQPEVFREMLASFAPESRLAVCIEALLKNGAVYVRGRHRVVSRGGNGVMLHADEEGKAIRTPQKTNGMVKAKGSIDGKARRREAACRSEVVAIEDRFRSDAYKDAVRTLAYQEFKGLSHSTIRAVLAEHNHSYTDARSSLFELNNRSWRVSISLLFSRPKRVAAQDGERHPLVVWQSTGRGSIIPTLKSTGSSELDRELHATLIVPLQQKLKQDQEIVDLQLARSLNTEEAEDNEALHDCECCFIAYPFEEFTACTDGGHFICFTCVRRAVNEAVFGQGWARSMSVELGTLRCIAPMADDCVGHIPRSLLDQAFALEKGGQDIVSKLDERLAEDALLKTRLPLVRCPFCAYAELDESYLSHSLKGWRFRRDNPFTLASLLFLLVAITSIPFLLPCILLLLTVSYILTTTTNLSTPLPILLDELHSSLTRHRRSRRLKTHGLRFHCRNPSCSRISCLECHKPWLDIHTCHESSLLLLRTAVETAMSQAIKRTCPRCNTSFVKASGCNKLTCVCGYQMCYVCRKDIGGGKASRGNAGGIIAAGRNDDADDDVDGAVAAAAATGAAEGYRHFCEHFRPLGGECTLCRKCDLYRNEDESAVVRRAKEEAERAWWASEGRRLGLGGENAVRALDDISGAANHGTGNRGGDGGGDGSAAGLAVDRISLGALMGRHGGMAGEWGVMGWRTWLDWVVGVALE